MPSTKKDRILLDEPNRNVVLNAKVRQFVRDATGDPRLTVWEENFLVSIAAWVAPDGPGAHRPAQRHENSTAPQLDFRLGAMWDNGDRMQPSIEAADIDADEAAQRRKVGEVSESEPDFAVSLVRMLDCPAPILRPHRAASQQCP